MKRDTTRVMSGDPADLGAPMRAAEVPRDESATVFLLSPAYCGGRRANILLRDGASSSLALRLRGEDLTLGEAFAFFSGLYFRGKLTYARAFGRASDAPVLVITPTRGLQPPETIVTLELLREFAGVDVSTDDARYRVPLERDVAALAARLPRDARVVLLGSIATGKYVDTLLDVFGERLLFPETFVGRGDMSRGGLMLRAARSGEELAYCPVAGAKRHGARPPKLSKLPRSPALAAKPSP